MRALIHRRDCTGPRESKFIGRRGDLMLGCMGCAAAVPADEQVEVVVPASMNVQVSRYLLVCVRCNSRIPTHRPEARLPICRRCRERAETTKRSE